MNDCPQQEQLVDLINDRLPNETLEKISDHIESCAHCQQRLAQLTNSDQDQHFSSTSIEASVSDDKGLLERLSKRVLDEVSPAIEAASPYASASLSADATIGDYQIIEPIGRGGMGTVYKARHTKLDRLVAIKVVEIDSFTDANRIARFRRESKAIGRLRHPNIVAAHDAGEQGNYHYLVMEYIDGIDLSNIIRNRIRVSMKDACELIRQAAVGLQHCHEAGLVHRDIKPSNIMLSVADGQPTIKLLDLGLAQIIDAASNTENQLTQTGRIIGTLDYMAPEQFDGSEVDIRADIYSLGTTLYALLAGTTPFNFGKAGILQRMQQRATKPHQPLATFCADLPDELTDFVDQMLAADPNNRPTQPQEVADRLQQFCEGHDLIRLADSIPKTKLPSANDTSVNHVTLDARGQGFVPLTPSGRIDVNQSRPQKRSTRTVVLASAFAVVALLACSSAFYYDWTNTGTIIVSADNPNLEIELIRDEAHVQRMSIDELSENNTFRCGSYEIRVPGNFDADLKISNPLFELSRGQTQQISISFGASNTVDQSLILTGPATDPGKTFNLTFTPVCLLFRNHTNSQIDIRYVDFAGVEKEVAQMPPDSTWNPSTGHGHLFRFYRDGQLLTFYQVQKPHNQVCVFSQFDPNDPAISVSTHIAQPVRIDTKSVYQIRSTLKSDMSIDRDDNSNRLVLKPTADGSTNIQHFRFIDAGDEAYYLESVNRPGMVFQIPDIASLKLNLYLAKKLDGLDSLSQQFKIYRASSDNVRIVSIQSEAVHIGIDEATDELVAKSRSFDDNTMFGLIPVVE